MITLAIETSTERGSVAVLEDGRTLFDERFLSDRGHSSDLFLSLQHAVASVPHYDQLIVGLGPGSYSGVRIAIAAIIGLEFALKAPVAGISSIVALEPAAPKYLFVGDARRSTFYFAVVEDGECISGPMLLDESALFSAIASYDSVPVYGTAPVQTVSNLEIRYPSAHRLALLAQLGRGIYARDNLEPIYLRDPHITRPGKTEQGIPGDP